MLYYASNNIEDKVSNYPLGEAHNAVNCFVSPINSARWISLVLLGTQRRLIGRSHDTVSARQVALFYH